MGKNQKVLLGLLSFSPIFGFVFAYLVGLSELSSIDTPGYSPFPFELFWPVIYLTLFLTYALSVFYTTLLLKTGSENVIKRALWILGLFMIPVLTLPAYWYLQVKRS